MSRLLAAALAALLLLPGAARAQADAKKAETPPAQDEVDAKTKAAIERAVEKAKEDLRDEVRAEIQGAQSAAEFLGAVAEGPKLEFLELNGYLRTRGQVLVNLDLDAGFDPSGFTLFPRPLQDPEGRDTLATANMRFRLEPTLNVSESVRLRAQVDVLDNYALGSSTSSLFDAPFSPYPVPFYGSSRLSATGDLTADRDPIQVKRAWAEIQTPVGLLSFGRMPSEWGLGILTHAGEGLDDDFGDTVDRLQFALPPVGTPLGSIVFVPILDFDSEGVLNADPRFGPGFGQPFDAESGDDARTYAIKAARIDTEDEIRRKLERNESSVNFGAYYNYRTQRWTYPLWRDVGFVDPNLANPYEDTAAAAVKRNTYAHVLDLWARVLTPRWRLELEGVGVAGHIGRTFVDVNSDTATPELEREELGRVLLRQWAATLVTEYQAIPGKVTVGGELGVASGDPAPGFGNNPGRYGATGAAAPEFPLYGSIEGPQFGQPGDDSIRNFRFNPAYRVDLILWQRILGQVTDAWYVKPKLRWSILPGLAFDAAVVYSQALHASSTPSASSAATIDDPTTPVDERYLARGGSKPLGLEVDGKLSLESGNGFVAWSEIGLLQPLGGLGEDLSRGWVLNFGLAAKF
jgi:uncharacterized protein (TIGR04551 family)